MELLDIIEESWNFTGLKPCAIIEINRFGNLLVEAIDGSYWRICPEELSCETIASSSDEFRRLRSSTEFQTDWEMQPLVELANAVLGPPPTGRCFCLKIPAVLGGAYDASNLGTITVSELLSVSGDIASQIKDLPNGTEVELEVVD